MNERLSRQGEGFDVSAAVHRNTYESPLQCPGRRMAKQIVIIVGDSQSPTATDEYSDVDTRRYIVFCLNITQRNAVQSTEFPGSRRNRYD